MSRWPQSLAIGPVVLGVEIIGASGLDDRNHSVERSYPGWHPSYQAAQPAAARRLLSAKSG